MEQDNLPKERCIDNFALSCYRSCPRLFYWRIVLDIVKPREKKIAAEFGSGIHYGLETYYKEGMTEIAKSHAFDSFTNYFTQFEEQEDTKRTVVKGIELLDKYFSTYNEEPFEVIATEIGGAFELGGYMYQTRIDLIVKWLSPVGYYGFDHKTTSALERLIVKPNNQLSGYCFNLVEMYEGVLGFQLNGIGVYDTDEVIDKTAPKVPSEKTGKLVYAKKKRELFRRYPTTRTIQELKEWKRDVLHTLHQIEDSRDKGIWPKYDHCGAYRGMCQYCDLCNAQSEDVVNKLIEMVYTKDVWQPWRQEEKEVEGNGTSE